MVDNTSFDPKYELDELIDSPNNTEDDFGDLRLDMTQLQNQSILSLAQHVVSETDNGNLEPESALDMSSLQMCDGSSNESCEGLDAQALYEDTLALMRAGKTDMETGVNLLWRSANGGYDKAYLYLGQIFSNKSYTLYNPALAFECYCGASKLNSPKGHYNKGLCYSQGFGCAQNDELAMECFCEGAEVYDPDCICAVAMCYEFGKGCEINYEYAFNLYKKGAELGHALCANNLGGCYFYGHGVEQDKALAIETFKLAATLGSANAKSRLGLCYMNGDGCEQNDAVAFEYFKSAAEENHATALFHLAKCYDQGIGTEQNFRLAFKNYSKAATLGHSESKYEAGKMNLQGRGTKKDPDAAYRMFSSAVRHGYAAAEYELANCFFDGTGAVRNRASAYTHYLSAYNVQDENQGDAAYRLGLCHLNGFGASLDKNIAVEWFEKGRALLSPEATYMLGECYYYGVGVAKDIEQAFNLYAEAAHIAQDSPSPIKCHAHLFLALAQCYESGAGTPKDAQKALAAYKTASEHGDEEALYRTGRAIISGIGMRSEYPAARTYFLRAARHGYMPAMLMMGIFSEMGKGVNKNRDDAKSWYSKAVMSKSSPKMSIYKFPERFAESVTLYNEAKTEAQYRFGMMIAHVNPSSQIQIRAFEYIAISAAMGYAPARREITKIHISGGDLKTYYDSPFSDENALFDGGYKDPSGKDLAIAMYKLGDAFFDGKGLLKKNEEASALCYKFSAELGMVDACYSYGWCLRHGVGIDENDAEAVKWLKLAADRGNANAAYSYGLCCEEGAGMGIKNKREAMYYYRNAAAVGHTEAAKRYVALSSRGE